MHGVESNSTMNSYFFRSLSWTDKPTVSQVIMSWRYPLPRRYYVGWCWWWWQPHHTVIVCNIKFTITGSGRHSDRPTDRQTGQPTYSWIGLLQILPYSHQGNRIRALTFTLGSLVTQRYFHSYTHGMEASTTPRTRIAYHCLQKSFFLLASTLQMVFGLFRELVFVRKTAEYFQYTGKKVHKI